MNPILKWLLMAAALLTLATPEARAWSSRASKTLQRVEMVGLVIEEYRTTHGRLPDHHTFQNKAGIDWPYGVWPPVDQWRREIIYRMPGEHGDFDIYSAGADGIDDHASRDDISNRTGVNEGYHWKRWWPLGRFTLIASLSLGMIVLLLHLLRPGPLSIPLAGMIMGLGTGLGCWWLRHPGVVPDHNFPLSIAGPVGLVVFAISLVKLMSVGSSVDFARRTRE